MTQEDRKRLEELAKSATPGEWQRGSVENGSPLFVYCDDVLGSAVCGHDSHYSAMILEQRVANLNFIAAANPQTILSLLTALWEAEEKRRQAEADFKNFHRNLCERFEYSHDDCFWWRDLCSLEEHVAQKVTAARQEGIREGMERVENMIANYQPRGGIGETYCSIFLKMIRRAKEEVR